MLRPVRNSARQQILNPRNTLKGLAKPLRLAALSLLLALTACTTVETPEPGRPVPDARFSAEPWERVPAAEPQAWSNALSAFRLSCARMGGSAPWSELCAEAAATPAESAESFFRARFTPWRIEASSESANGVEWRDTGLMTGYYEPLLHGSRTKGGKYVHPIYGVPDDLLIIALASLHPELKGKRLRGRLDGRRVVPYGDRAAITKRTDMDRWALAWVDDPVDAFFLQIQGSGRIALPDGSFMRVGFADQNGWPYKAIGKWLSEHEGIPMHALSMQRIRAWARANPSRTDEALAQNPSFVFFEERSGDPALGPLGAQGAPLTPRASVAADPRKWRLGTPFLIEASQDRPALSFVRPVVAQDTGGAIQGVLRFDFFWGFGDEAGAAAGRQKSRVRAWALVPNGLAPEAIRPGAR